MSHSSNPPSKPKTRNPIMPKIKTPKIRQSIWINSLTIRNEIENDSGAKNPQSGSLKKIFISQNIPKEKNDQRLVQQRGILWN